MFYEAFPKGGMQSISGGAKIHLKKVSQTASNSLKINLKQTNFPPQISPPPQKKPNPTHSLGCFISPNGLFRTENKNAKLSILAGLS